MKQAKQIEHRGVVTRTGRDCVSVTVEVNEACGGCASRRSCAMGASESREITIYTSEAHTYAVGEAVTVGARQSTGIMAVVLCYVVPLVVLVASLVAVILCGGSEGVAAASSLGGTALYYAILGVFHKRIAKRVTFTIKKNS